MLKRGVHAHSVKFGLAAIAAALLAVVSPASAGSERFALEGSKEVGSGYGELTRVNVARDSSEVVYLRATNLTDRTRTAKLTGQVLADNPRLYTVKYYKGTEPTASNDITNKALLDPFGAGRGYAFELEANSSRFFAVKIKRKSKGDPFCLRSGLSSEAFSFFDVNGQYCF